MNEWVGSNRVGSTFTRWVHTSGAVVRYAGPAGGMWPYYIETEQGQRRAFRSLSKAQEAALKEVRK